MSLQQAGTLTASGNSESWPVPTDRDFFITVTGDWEGSVFIQRRFNGTDWARLTFGGIDYEYRNNFSEAFGDVESNMLWRLEFERTSGTLEYYVSGRRQGRP